MQHQTSLDDPSRHMISREEDGTMVFEDYSVGAGGGVIVDDAHLQSSFAKR